MMVADLNAPLYVQILAPPLLPEVPYDGCTLAPPGSQAPPPPSDLSRDGLTAMAAQPVAVGTAAAVVRVFPAPGRRKQSENGLRSRQMGYKVSVLPLNENTEITQITFYLKK